MVVVCKPCGRRVLHVKVAEVEGYDEGWYMLGRCRDEL